MRQLLHRAQRKHNIERSRIWVTSASGSRALFGCQRFRVRAAGLLIAVALLLALRTEAQYSNLRTRIVPLQAALQLDSLSIMPPLIAVVDTDTRTVLPVQYFSLNNNQLYTDTAAVKRLIPQCQQLSITYRVLPFDLSRPVQRLDSTAIQRAFARENDIAFDYTPFPVTEPLVGGAGLRSTGAYTRGISLGNSQNLVFNSNLNLQFEGKLGSDLIVRGTLSDNSVPLQPDGATRQLQEFDRILIEIQRQNSTLMAGDFDLTRPTGYFSNYFKRIQGAKFTQLPKTNGPKISVGGGVSRGKFNRQIIQGQEGNQGPYRLQGAEGERFIIVLAGTEKVFVDGMLLQRGAQDDYVMDYNLGEITFMPKRLITKDIRIIVEFEYAVQNYLRSTAMMQADWQFKRGRTWLNLYSEQDSRTSSGAQNLSPAERSRLATTGDELNNAFASGVDTLPAFETSRVMYEAVDTLFCNGLIASVLVFSTNAEKARFTARFTEVPQGQGNYIQAPNAANGRVYRWVAPDPQTCQPRGNFEPIIRLLAPEQRQLHALGGEFQLRKNTKIMGEAALSQRDLNRFSPTGNNDNLGGSGYLSIQQQWAIPKGWKARFEGCIEVVSNTFLALNPYRNPEFVRDWNSDQFSPQQRAAEQVGRAALAGENSTWGQMRYEWGGYYRAGFYEGNRHLAQWKGKYKGWNWLAEWNDLFTTGTQEKTRFERPKFDLSKTFRWQKAPLLQVGLYGERERNGRRAATTDTLLRQSFWYDLLRLYWQQPANEKRRWNLGGYLSQRSDYAPVRTQFEQSTVANDLNVNGSWEHSRPQTKAAPVGTLSSNLTWRQLRITNPELTNEEAQNTYLGRTDYQLSAWKNALNYSTGYELGSGQTPKIEFNYLRVNPGEGQYAWVDRNRDSILQVDEMEVAVFLDQASFVRVAVTTPEYIRTNNTAFNQNLRIEPRLWWTKPTKNWQKWVTRLALQSTVQINRRVLSNAEGIAPWNPFRTDIPDSVLVTVNTSGRHALFVNRANPRWDLSFTRADNSSRLLITTGFERRTQQEYLLHLRANLNRRLSLEGDANTLARSNNTENFSNRNFNIEGWEFSPKLTWLANKTFRVSGRWSQRRRDNTIGNTEQMQQTDWKAELTWNPPARPRKDGTTGGATSIRGQFTLADIRYSGQPNTPVAFAMLEGLQDGRNFLWSCSLNRQLTKSMQLNITYEGRRTGSNARWIHVGRAQVRAVF
jgi:hypothetical protein